MQTTINPLNFLIKETESGFLWEQLSHVFLHGKRLKSPCTLCGAAAYCCGAVALLALPLPSLGVSSLDLGRLRHSRAALCSWRSAFSFARDPLRSETAFAPIEARRSFETRVYSAAAWNGPRSPNGIVVAKTSARTPKS